MTVPEAPVWLRSRNLSADAKGSIHDDERARSLGFKAALIGGSVHSAFVTKAAVECFGQAWYERGFMKQAYIAPLYETDEFRIVMTPLPPLDCDEELRELAFETKAGLRTTAGFFGILKAGADPIVPWEREDAPERDSQVAQATPDERSTFTQAVEVAESASRRMLSGDTSRWYTDQSPWGGAIVPSFMYMLIGSGSQRRERASDAGQQAGMNSVWQLVQSGPMLAGAPHTITRRTVEAGEGGRTSFRTNELTIATQDGRTVARARQKVRWFRAQ